MTTDLTPKEKLELEEEIIESHMDSFVAVGESLQRIRDQALYLATHKTFGDYVEQRWRKKRRWAQLAILDVQIASDAGDVKMGGNLGQVCAQNAQTTPKLTSKPILRTRAHRRALQAAPSEQRKAILDAAVKEHGPDLTAVQLERTVEKKRRKAVERDPIPEDGTDITPHVQAALDAVPRFEALRRECTALHKKIEELSAEDCGAFLLQEMSHVTATFNTVKGILKFQAPYADCVLCTQAGCKACRNTGWVPKLVFETFPEASQKRSYVRG